MKKILSYLLLFFMIMFTGIISVNAANYFKMEGCPSGTGKFTLKISGSYVSDIEVEVTTSGSITRLNGNKTFTLNESKKEVNIDFNATGNGTVTAKITNGVAISPKERTCKIGSTTKPTSKKTPTPQPTPTKTTTSSKSNNSNLKALIIKSQDGVVLSYKPDFKADTYEYTVDADSSVNKVTLQPSTEDSKANVVIEPSNYNNVTIKDGETTKIAIIVTAEDGVSKKTYNVNIKKTALNRDATLKSLTIAELPNFKFVSTQDTYDLPVSGNYKKLDIKCVPNNDKAKCVITGNENLKNGSIIRVVVTSESDTTKVYTLNIVRKVVTTEAQVNASGDKDPLIIIILSVVAVFLISAIIGVLRK